MPAPMTATCTSAERRAPLRSQAQTPSTRSSANAGPHTIRPTGHSPFAVAGQRQRAAVEQVDQRRIAQQQRVGGEEGLVVVDQRLQVRCNDRHGGREQGIDAGQRDLACARSSGVARSAGPCSRLRRRPRRGGCATRRADRIAASRLARSPTVPGPALGRGEPAAALQRSGIGQRGQVDLVDVRSAGAQCGNGALERRRDGRLQRV